MVVKLYRAKENTYRKKLGSVSPPLYPNEMLVKICSSKGYSKLTGNLFNKKLNVCEIGSFAGNNLRFFLNNGHNVYGVEINKYLLQLCNKYLKTFKIKKKPKLLVGNNLSIPLPKKTLDLFISINTIHYNTGEKISLAIENFKSLVKKNGIIIIETPGPKHMIFKKSKKIKNLVYKFKLPFNDHREGINMGLFDNETQLSKLLQKKFKNFEILRRTEKYKTYTYDFFIAICKV